MSPWCKCFGPWDVKCLLSLLDSWTPASSLSNFKLAGKTSTLLAVVTAKCCSNLTLLHFDNQYLFVQHYTTIFVPESGYKMDWHASYSTLTPYEYHYNVNICPLFYLKAYLWHIVPFRKKSDGCQMSCLFWGNNRQHIPVCSIQFLIG